MSRVWMAPRGLGKRGVRFNGPMARASHGHARRRHAAVREPDDALAQPGTGARATVPHDTAVLPLVPGPRRRRRGPPATREPLVWLTATGILLFGVAVVLLVVSLSGPTVGTTQFGTPLPEPVSTSSPPPTSTVPPTAPTSAVTTAERPRRAETTASDPEPALPAPRVRENVVDPRDYIPRGVFPGGG